MEISSRAKQVFYPIIWFTCGNFVVFSAIAYCIGGSAFNGSIEDGHYFVADHDRITEVCAGKWYFSYAHTVVVIVSFGVLTIMFYALWILGELEP